MPVITDALGTREISEAELARHRAEADARLDAFWAALDWRPIGDCARDHMVLVRDRDDWAVAVWAAATPELLHSQSDDLGPMWRDRREPFLDQPLGFAPIEFATADGDCLCALCED